MVRTFDYEKFPIVEVVNEILLDSMRRGSSDIHFDPTDEDLKIRIRIDGELTEYTRVPNHLKRNLITRIKIISGMNITEMRLPQDGAIKTVLKDTPLDLRVSSLPTNVGEKIVIRILDYSMSLAGLESLGFTEVNFNKLSKMINVPNGIILVTGATGSGKSTTVYSILQKLNREEVNLITVEDPIEMDIEGINQVQVNSEIGLDFSNVLRSILRQDPDIIMIGEIRDHETAKIAVRASITGHLVLSTLHTNNSLNTIERLLDMDVERYLLASALTGIISQKLAKKLCEHCKKTRPANVYEQQLFAKIFKKNILELPDIGGCDHCSNGYRGRIAIHEVLLINQDIRDAISENIRKDSLRELVYKGDVATLLKDGLEKVLMGLTTFEEILKLIEFDDEDDSNLSGAQYSLNAALKDTNLTQNTNIQNTPITPTLPKTNPSQTEEILDMDMIDESEVIPNTNVTQIVEPTSVKPQTTQTIPLAEPVVQQAPINITPTTVETAATQPIVTQNVTQPTTAIPVTITPNINPAKPAVIPVEPINNQKVISNTKQNVIPVPVKPQTTQPAPVVIPVTKPTITEQGVIAIPVPGMPKP